MTEREILNIEEAAALLGVSIKTFNKVLHAEDMPARKIGREWKFSRQALVDWVGSGHSRDFYREHGNGQERELPARPAPPAAQPRPPEGQRRRTAGWQIEMD
jgi:excisionase family DNA binding protein